MTFRVVAKYDTNALLVEAREYENGTATLYWTDGPRWSEEDAASLDEAVALVYEAKAEHDALGYESAEVQRGYTLATAQEAQSL